MSTAPRRSRPGAPTRRALSMIEAVMSIAILSLLVLAALQVAGSMAARDASTRGHARASGLAAELMAEILSHAYEDPDEKPVLGPEEPTVTREQFDDVDDYHNWQAEPPEQLDGTPVDGAGAYKRAVNVTWVEPKNLDTPTGMESGVKRIDVTVSRGEVEVARLATIRTSAWGTEEVARGPSFAGFSETKQATDATATSLPVPVGTAAGDLLVAAVATDGDTAATLSAPAGWNLVVVKSEGAAVTLGVWWKIATVAEAPTHAFSWLGGPLTRSYGWMMRFTGHDAGSPVHAWAVQSAAAGLSPPSPAVTTTVDDTLILRIGGFDDCDITEDSPGLAGLTPITMDTALASPLSASGGAGFSALATAGSSATSAFELTAMEESVTVTIAVAPGS